jgi:hypothetical protein
MNDVRGIGLDEMRRACHALSGLLWYVALVIRGVTLGWSITPLRGLGTRGELSDGLGLPARAEMRGERVSGAS